MLGLRGKTVETCSWSEKEWRLARIWNSAFFAGWTIFFAFALSKMNWSLAVPTFSLAMSGGIIQLVWLIRVSKWLRNQKVD